MQQICKVLGCTQVLPLHQSYPAIYGADPDTTLLAMIRGNPSYKGVYTPMEQHQVEQHISLQPQPSDFVVYTLAGGMGG